MDKEPFDWEDFYPDGRINQDNEEFEIPEFTFTVRPSVDRTLRDIRSLDIYNSSDWE